MLAVLYSTIHFVKKRLKLGNQQILESTQLLLEVQKVECII